MPKINVYLPDELAEAVKEAGVPVSAICQRALEQAVRRVTAIRASVPADLDPDRPSGALSHLTARTRTVLKRAADLAAAGRAPAVGTEHLLAAMLDEGTNLALHVLRAMDIDPAHARPHLPPAPTPEGASRLPGVPPPEGAARAAAAPGTEGAHGLPGAPEGADRRPGGTDPEGAGALASGGSAAEGVGLRASGGPAARSADAPSPEGAAPEGAASAERAGPRAAGVPAAEGVGLRASEGPAAGGAAPRSADAPSPEGAAPEGVAPEGAASEGAASGVASSGEQGGGRFSGAAANALEFAVNEAASLGHNYIGCEHLLLGLVNEPDGTAGQVLRGLGAEPRLTRRAVVAALAGYVHLRAQAQQAPTASAPAAGGPVAGAPAGGTQDPAQMLAAVMRDQLQPVIRRLERLEERAGLTPDASP
ncbi:Clp protease N-terminal domain-containing protein [Nonomuraea sp. NPDC049725]|uniref:Clp protease N-terminal domain-containing protein n=1 Tax=Nonomuraea sp. NPDC049725 TaxID=3154508 RepID=UPI003441EB01